jgi:hypothetical protein
MKDYHTDNGNTYPIVLHIVHLLREKTITKNNTQSDKIEKKRRFYALKCALFRLSQKEFFSKKIRFFIVFLA